MKDIKDLLRILFEKELLSSKDIASLLFSGNMDKTYKLVSEAQKRQLVTSRRKGTGGGRSPKVYKITRKGARIIGEDPDKTPEFPTQSDYMRRKLIIAEITEMYRSQNKEVYTGEEARNRLAEHIATLEKCDLYIANDLFPKEFKFKDLLAFEHNKPVIYYIPIPQEAETALRKRLKAYSQIAGKYADLIVMPITEMQRIIYSRIPKKLMKNAKINNPIL